MKTLLLCSSLFLITFSGIAQQIPHFTQYMFNGVLQNPAYVSKPDYAEATLFYRNQWLGIPGAPITKAAMLTMPFQREKMSLGGSVLQSSIGPSSILHAMGYYGYRVQVNKTSMLALGFSFGMIQYRFDTGALITRDELESDPILSSLGNTIKPDFGFGAVYKTSKYLVGISIPHLFPATIGASKAKLAKHYYFMGQYKLYSSPVLDVIPSVMMKMTKGNAPQFDANTNFTFYKKFWVGASYRTGDAISALAGVYLLNSERVLKIGYAYDLTMSTLNPYNSGTHEIMLSMSFRVRSAIKCAMERPLIRTFDW